jgi:hypothetical protein
MISACSFNQVDASVLYRIVPFALNVTISQRYRPLIILIASDIPAESHSSSPKNQTARRHWSCGQTKPLVPECERLAVFHITSHVIRLRVAHQPPYGYPATAMNLSLKVWRNTSGERSCDRYQRQRSAQRLICTSLGMKKNSVTPQTILVRVLWNG